MIRILIILFFLILLVSIASATNYTVIPLANKESGISVDGKKITELDPIPYWLYLLLMVFPQITAMPLETLVSIKLLPYLGYKKIVRKNILDNPVRLKIYNFIKEHPGVYFRELIKKTELKKGTVEYHMGMIKTEEMITVYKTNGKLRYFLNNSTYAKEERTVISALKNDTHRRIILEILGNQSINHKTLAERIGVSSPTITQHIKHLKEQGIVKADTNGRYTTYSIDSNYFDSLQKYMSITS